MQNKTKSYVKEFIYRCIASNETGLYLNQMNKLMITVRNLNNTLIKNNIYLGKVSRIEPSYKLLL